MSDNFQPRIEARPVLSFAALRQRLPRERIGQLVPAWFGQLAAWLGGQQIAISGVPLIRYLEIDFASQQVEIEIGFPVAVASLPADAQIYLAHLPAGSYACVTHAGPYENLVNTTGQLLEWGRQHGGWAQQQQGELGIWQGRYEHYLQGPPAVSNPADWRTEVAIMLA